MRKISVNVTTGYAGASKDCVFEVEDDMSYEEINEIALERVFAMIEWSWHESNE